MERSNNLNPHWFPVIGGTLLIVLAGETALFIYYRIAGLPLHLSDIIAALVASVLTALALGVFYLFVSMRYFLREKHRDGHVGMDPVTGLKSRKGLLESARELYEISRRYQRKVAVLLLGVDHFKKINLRYGYLNGDLVLLRLGDLVLHLKRESDVCGRLEGDKILVVLPETDEDGCRLFAEKVLKEVRNSRVRFRDDELDFRISIGISARADSSPVRNIEQLIDQAAKALGHAKARGRDRYYLYPMSQA